MAIYQGNNELTLNNIAMIKHGGGDGVPLFLSSWYSF